jgi:hypothetical protein
MAERCRSAPSFSGELLLPATIGKKFRKIRRASRHDPPIPSFLVSRVTIHWIGTPEVGSSTGGTVADRGQLTVGGT